MGPFNAIGIILLKKPWAHTVSLRPPLSCGAGTFSATDILLPKKLQAHSTLSALYFGGAIRDNRHYILMGPRGFFRNYRSICTWVLT